MGPKMPALLQRALEKAIALAQSPVAGYVDRLRRARPLASPAEIITVLEKQYLATVTGTGAAVGGAAVAPGIGTVAALALTGGETALFLETTALFALAVAEVHGIRVEEVERRRTLVLAVALGDSGAMLVEKMAGRGGQQWGALLPEAIPMSSITAINKTLGRWFFTRYGRKQGVLALGRIAPFGIGVAIGAVGNRAFGRVVVDTSRRVFGPPPERFPAGSAVTIIEGTVG
ncbi:MAG: hypothetical protein QOJ06_2927 [Pseudonocardiales bacterium]|nr:hypothetical protein [Pseudonocardiales bacterium]